MKLLIATGNKGKMEEAREILRIPLEVKDVDLEEVQSMDLEHVAKRKAEVAFDLLKKPLIVDDVGVFIEAWNGFPGPFAKYLFESLGYDGILRLLEKEDNRNVIVRSAVGYHDGKNVHVFVGEAKGKLTRQKRGERGWGFDPIIIPEGFDQTFAEMGPEGKNKISHRRKALDKLREYLDSQGK